MLCVYLHVIRLIMNMCINQNMQIGWNRSMLKSFPITPTTHPPHTHHTPTTHPPHTHYTPTTHPPHTHHTPTTHPLHTHYTPTTHPLHTHHTPTTHPPHTHYTPTTHPCIYILFYYLYSVVIK